jgi:hypothetical protein
MSLLYSALQPKDFHLHCLYHIMATAAVQTAPGHTVDQKVEVNLVKNKPQKHDVATELYYYKDLGDGKPPAPTYVGFVIIRLVNRVQ